MKEAEFEKIKNGLQMNMGQWKIEIGIESFADYVMGCYYDQQTKNWKVYINNERGRHRVRLNTTNESEAFDELLSMAEFEIQNNKLI